MNTNNTFVQESKSQWNQSNCIPIRPFLIISSDENEFWLISKHTNTFIQIFKYNANHAIFSKHLQIKQTFADKNVLAAAYHKQNKTLYIITPTQIICLNVLNNEYETISTIEHLREQFYHYSCTTSQDNEDCGCVLSQDGKLHIIANFEGSTVGATSYYIMSKQQNNFEFKFVHYLQIQKGIINPRIVAFETRSYGHEMTIIGDRTNACGVLKGISMYYYMCTSDNRTQISGKLTGIGSNDIKLCKYPHINYNIKHTCTQYNIFFMDDRILINKTMPQTSLTWYLFSNITLPITPTNAILLKQSLKQNNLLFIGYIKGFIDMRKTKIIPMDVINLINMFYASYNAHIFDCEGNHFRMSMDEIINNSQKYIGVIKAYNQTKDGTIQIKGTINEFWQNKYPLINGVSDEPTEIQKPLINALTKMFERFCSNEDHTMCMNDMRKYILYCGAGEDAASTKRIKCIFSKYGKTAETFCIKGFIDFYADAIIDRPEHVMSDLKVFGYKEEQLFKETGECIHALFGDYEYNDEYKIVYFDIGMNYEYGTKYAINVTKAYSKASLSEFIDK